MKEGFPIELIKPEMSVLCLFAAKFHGINDVQFIHQAGCRDVTLVDMDSENLALTGKEFNYQTVCVDIFAELEADRLKGKYDVVVSDQWNGSPEQLVHGKYFNQMAKMTNKYLILSCSELVLQGKRPCGTYYMRNANYLGGVYWRVIKIRR